jgi:dipeptidyl aminopeptidase/acylaminoacyl peptidase
MAKKSGAAWKINLIPGDGGPPEELIQSDESQWHPTWSPKGDSLMFGNPWWSAAPAIHQVDVATRSVSTLPGSQGLYSPRWSPDGRFVAAVSKDSRTVMLFDFTTQHWAELAVMDSVGYLTWSRKGEYLYFDAATKDGVSIYRVSARDHRLERVTAIPPPTGLAFGLFGPWTGLDPEDSPLLMRDTSVQEIYALDLQLP